MSDDEPLLRITGLSAGYGDDAPAVRDVGLEVRAGEITALVGASGSGKTTTAHAVVGLLPGRGRIREGSIRLAGRELVGLGPRAWRGVRGRQVGLVPQDPGVALDPVAPVGRQVAEVLRVHGLADRRGARARAIELLGQAGLPDAATRVHQYPHELSGGMRQRVLIAMATAARPRLLVADEPTSALDVTVQRRILDHLDGLVASTGTGVLLVTHDLAVAADRAHRVVVMSDGEVAEAGPVSEVLAQPSSPVTRRLLTDVPGRGTRHAGRPTATTHDAEDTGGEPLLQVERLSTSFAVRDGGLRRRHRTVVAGVDLAVRRGRSVGLIGESGSGKTTIARTVVGLETPTAGTVRFDGADVTGVRGAARRRLHRRMQMIYQDPYASLNPRLSVGDVVAEPLAAFGIVERSRRPAAVRELLDAVALPAGVAERHAGELSGGQRQRVAIARVLAVEPDLVVCDEPVSALDVTVQAQILTLLRDLQEQRGLSYLFISHDLAVVRDVCDEIVVLRAGEVVETGHADRILTEPRHPYTAELLAAVPGARAGASR